MTNAQDLVICIATPKLKNEFKGRKTVPTTGLDSPAFEYTPAIKTDLRETFRKAREKLEAA